MSLLRALLLGVLAMAGAAPKADFIWIEGENPAAKSVNVALKPWESPRFSGGSWLQIGLDAGEVEKQIPKEGLVLSYALQAPSAGKYEAWNRVGFQFVRSPFEWRVDEGAWQTVKPDDLITDLEEMATWVDVAWLKMGDVELTAGTHTLQIRLTPWYKEDKGKQVLQNINYASDAVCFTQGAFHPNGRFKPGEAYQSDADRQAAAQVFEVKAGAAGERAETPLSGNWEVCRYDEQDVVDRDSPTQTLPDPAQAFWTAIPVPGNKFTTRPELGFCHRLVYRTRVNVPAEAAGRSFFLRFPSVSLIASAIVNGQFCGGTRAPFALWECDVTRAIRPGQVNEICVVVKDSYYAFSEKKSGKNARFSFNIPTEWIGTKNWVWPNFDFPIGSGYAAQSGILEAPSFVTAGTVYATDVFAQPSVRKKELGLEVTLLNPTTSEQKVQLANEVVPTAGGAAEKRFAPQEVTLAPGEEKGVKLAEAWENPALWWPDKPRMYQVVTTVSLGGRTVDTRRTSFGFREWEWSGKQFKLNGVPWQLWADTTYGDGGKDPEAAVAYWRKSGQNMWRFWGQQFGGLDKEKALDFMDTHGVIVRRSGIFDGEGANYLHKLADGRELFDNWITQLKAQVKAERNHPSVLIWSLENEITFINSRNLGLAERVEPQIERGAKEILAFDPTRPVMVDGGHCLVDESLPVNGVHYQEGFWRDYPDEAYTLANAYQAHLKPVIGWGKVLWRLVPEKPIFMGESYYLRGNKPGDFAQFGGEGCFAGWSEHTRRGAGLLAKMLAEGYRWHGVAAHHFWLGSDDDGGLHHNSWQPVCVLCRQWNWSFGGGSQVSRTLKVFNDTEYNDPITAGWALLMNGKKVAGAERVFALAPGENQEYTVTVPVPKVAARTRAQFVLTCKRGGKEVFRETKPVAIIDPNAGPRPKVAKADLIVLDPAGTVKARLKARGVPFTEAASVAAIPAKARVIVIGHDALSAREATDPRWMALAAGGAHLLVLDQAHPLHYQALPADMTPTEYTGRIAFSENLAHPVFAGLDQPDFFTWSKDHIVYRNAYTKPTHGAISLAHCDEQLNYSALAECAVNDGLMVLCQLVVGEKLAFDPVAQRLFDNLLAYAAGYAPVRRKTAVVMSDANPAAKLLADSGLKYDKAADVVTAVSDGKHEIVVFEATPANLRALVGAQAKVKAFTAKGGWLMAWGVTPEGLASFNKLVGVEHLLRPFDLERVTLPAVRDPLTSGLTVRDVALESNEKIFGWAGDHYMVDDEFTSIVDVDDIAPFCQFPNAKAGDHKAARDAGASWSRNMVNGFTSADAWKLIYYMGMDSPKITLKLPRPEEITDLGIVLNLHYCKATKVNLYYDDDPKPVSLTTQTNAERQEFALPPRKASALTLELASFDSVGKTTGIDNVWIKVKRSEEWRQKVKPLLNIGGLVKYPMGQGGILLNQLNILEKESVPINAQKKRAVVATLLRNLHATFAGGRVLTTANLKFQPLPLNDQCNQYLTKERGWFDGGRDLSHLPVGNVRFSDVPYVLRDFRTSPVPGCVMLAGPGTRGQLPNEVKGLKVEGKADVLFFLHTFNQREAWRGRQNEQPPVLFRYVVHYADGQSAEVPVVWGEGVGHWVSTEPAGLKSASVAWSARFPGQETPGAAPAGQGAPEQAVVYQLSWNNPRPDVAIQSIDLAYGPSGSRYGIPALLGITAATAEK